MTSEFKAGTPDMTGIALAMPELINKLATKAATIGFFMKISQ